MLQGKMALITGCSRGIGAAILQELAANHASVFACVRRTTSELDTHFRKLQTQYGIEIIPTFLDISNTDSVRAAAQQISKSKRKLDILVNNAGITEAALFEMTSETVIRNMFEVNLFGPMLFTQYLLKRFASGGSIINISSSSAVEANYGLSAYASSKAALLTWSRCLARELGPRNIRVNIVAPGITQTDILNNLSEDEIQKRISGNALGRIGQPAEIATTVLFLASDKSSYITGQVFRVDGGM